MLLNHESDSLRRSILIATVGRTSAAVLSSAIIGGILLLIVIAPIGFSSSYRRSFLPHLRRNIAWIAVTLTLVAIALVTAREEARESLAEQLVLRGLTTLAFLGVLGVALLRLKRQHPSVWRDLGRPGIISLHPESRRIFFRWAVRVGLICVAIAGLILIAFDLWARIQ